MKTIILDNYSTNSKSEKWNKIMNDFKDKITLCFTKEKTPFCRYDLKNIYFRYEVYKNPTEDDLFDLLHEIGHIQTNNTSMKRCEEEFYATQWAIEHIEKYDIKIPKERLKEFQKYIWMWRDVGIRHRAKNIPSKQQLKLKF